MAGRTGLVAMVLVLMAAGGCAPRFDRFHYLSLAGVEGIEVLKSGEVDRVTLFDKPIPMRYRLVRDAYVLEFVFDLARNGSPSVEIKVARPREEAMLEASRDDRCDRWRHSGWSNSYIYTWSSLERCLLEGEEAAARQVIGLVVRDGAGKVLGREELPFEIVENGFTITVDAI
ncbi:MAG: hypothetical protein F4220_10965 [Gammaproteobacteria bacterium]|nr:hypothetical protein [Gammaproteobacteria bacterium]MXY06790.1 hypothetical protein [Gammaproteobacteria bacterium]MYF50653.1 hypothetical protein [Gammaproteobacteria bacterium]